MSIEPTQTTLEALRKDVAAMFDRIPARGPRNLPAPSKRKRARQLQRAGRKANRG
jgi:hypothetical protein